ncbi:hypothetical protein KEF29_16810 [Streptomyces tuirus]|uniref:Serine hydroxymethyltransferase-like domain-containing protein n=1 Tax=Streptomyces tuirus TaxID=68278 RepID=A0A941J2T3_9ACTN|nr:hypothetical protein [Streptomyces tuirus]
MIAAENFAPVSATTAQGPAPTDTYAEGHPGRRCHGGREHVDTIDRPTVDRAGELFGARAADAPRHHVRKSDLRGGTDEVEAVQGVPPEDDLAGRTASPRRSAFAVYRRIAAVTGAPPSARRPSCTPPPQTATEPPDDQNPPAGAPRLALAHP